MLGNPGENHGTLCVMGFVSGSELEPFLKISHLKNPIIMHGNGLLF